MISKVIRATIVTAIDVLFCEWLAEVFLAQPSLSMAFLEYMFIGPFLVFRYSHAFLGSFICMCPFMAEFVNNMDASLKEYILGVTIVKVISMFVLGDLDIIEAVWDAYNVFVSRSDYREP